MVVVGRNVPVVFQVLLIDEVKAVLERNIRVISYYVTGHDIPFATGVNTKFTQFLRQIFGSMNNGRRRFDKRFEFFIDIFGCWVHNCRMSGYNWTHLYRFFMDLRNTIKGGYMMLTSSKSNLRPHEISHCAFHMIYVLRCEVGQRFHLSTFVGHHLNCFVVSHYLIVVDVIKNLMGFFDDPVSLRDRGT